ncbi:serine hydrolase domain-containing protein [Nocardia sp. NPDC051832]|uniref:serine hydrolase domain-containing protein n=1 Tax=Nocardia sp. NPDC051832 TaxID=3155673 RepID=UPI00342C47D4
MVVSTIAAALLAASAVSNAHAAPDDPDQVALRQALHELVAAGAAGVQVRVHDNEGNRVLTAGTARLGTFDPVPADARFRIGSITKTFVATVVLQLVAEARLRLDDPVDQYLPQFGLDRRITVRTILDHTSGLRNAGGQPGPRGESAPSMFGTDPMQTYQPEDMVRFAAGQPLWFEPGTDWYYSNTNYILAGLLIETVTGTPYSRQLQQRIIEPLGLSSTSLPGISPEIPGPHTTGYRTAKFLGIPLPIDVTALNPSFAGAAGEIISTTADLDAFSTALWSGELLPPALLAQMRTVRPIAARFGVERGYGLGLMELTAGGCAGIGNSGDIPGFHSEMYSTADGSRRVAVSVNQGMVDNDDPVAFSRYMSAAYRVALVGLCGGAP